MIITGNIDRILEYDGAFAILKTEGIACEKDHKDGYNSSIMIWNGSAFANIFNELKSNFENISKFIVRFDYWLEMMINNADFLQELYP